MKMKMKIEWLSCEIRSGLEMNLGDIIPWQEKKQNTIHNVTDAIQDNARQYSRI